MNRGTIYRALATKYGYTPQEIADMTPAQQLMMLEEQDGEDPRTGRPTRRFNSMNDYQRFRASQKA